MDPAALCRSCSHYFVTHEPARPHGCRAFGFSSAEVPAAVVAREVPSAVRELPSPALGTAGGGAIPIDPGDASGRTAFSDVFQFDLTTRRDLRQAAVGTRVHVRFDHGFEPLGFRWYRSVRQLLLSEFDV